MRLNFSTREAWEKWGIRFVLLGGDLFVLAWFGIFFLFTPPPMAASRSILILELVFSTAPLFLFWILLGWRFDNFDVSVDFGRFIGKSLLVLLAAEFLSITAGQVYSILVRGMSLTFGGVIFHLISGLFIVGGWRFAFKTIHGLATQNRFPILAKIVQVGLVVIFCLSGYVLLLRLFVVREFSNRVFSPDSVPAQPVAIVFGAGVYPNGTPSLLLDERLETAARLFRTGKVSEVILSGDGSSASYNESGVMVAKAQELGIPIEAILRDDFGYNTHATCVRAKTVFGKGQVILVSQPFHLARMLLICNSLGVESVAVAAGQNELDIQSSVYWALREIPATANAWWNLNISIPAQ
jgi:vancomycin permeability regulator SanA